MTKKKSKKSQKKKDASEASSEVPPEAPVVEAPSDNGEITEIGTEEDAASERPEGEVLDETEVEAQAAELETQIEELKDKYLRLAAEYDNYRKRTSKQLVETGVRAQAELLTRVLDALDDLGRVTEIDHGQAEARDVLRGVEMVERKFFRELEGLGLEIIGEEGQSFDPNEHEAVATAPADDDELHNTVANVLQRGYRLGSVLVRPARVRVYT